MNQLNIEDHQFYQFFNIKFIIKLYYMMKTSKYKN